MTSRPRNFLACLGARKLHALTIVCALLCAGGTWTYMERVLIPYQQSDAAPHGHPRGNLSDLYPRWLGARELLLHGLDPYGPEVSRQIQEGFYGQVLEAGHSDSPRDQEKFAYPVYVVFLLAPMMNQPFAVVRQEAIWFFLVLTIATVVVWLRILGWSPPPLVRLAIVILALGSLPVVQGLKLQQITLFVAALLAFAIWLLRANRPVAAGVMLAVATIKPQLVGILLLWLLLWTSADWRRRFRWLPSFLLTLGTLFVFSEHYLPHWLPRFFQGLREYRHYADAVSIVGKLVPAPWDVFVLLLLGAATCLAAWKSRQSSVDSHEFSTTTALVLATTIILIPSYALYNQVLLVPALLGLVSGARGLWNGGMARRIFLLFVALLLIWPWLAALVLGGGTFFFPPATVQKAWAVPFWSALLLPVAVAALVLLAQFSEGFAAHEPPVAS